MKETLTRHLFRKIACKVVLLSEYNQKQFKLQIDYQFDEFI